jgi:DNA-binding NarL/FixJ family response regulator
MAWGVLLVDDSALVREGLRLLFDGEPAFEIYGEAIDGREAIEKAEKLKPRLIVLDFAMPVMNGFQAAPHLLKKLPDVILILVTMYAEETEARAHEVGFHAVIHKNKVATHLIPTARALFTQVPGRRATKA